MLAALLRKELYLSAHILSYVFIAFSLMTFLPGYPILMGPFFVCLGLFQSYQAYRESNDIVFSALLPVSKRDIVKGKFLFALIIEAAAWLLMVVITLLRMTVFSSSEVYLQNALMNANLFFLGMALLIFGLFNLVFIGGFFKTIYKFGGPFIAFIVVSFVATGIAETLHHIPGFEALNAFGFDNLGLQLVLLAAGAVCFALLTLLAFRRATATFEQIDL